MSNHQMSQNHNQAKQNFRNLYQHLNLSKQPNTIQSSNKNFIDFKHSLQTLGEISFSSTNKNQNSDAMLKDESQSSLDRNNFQQPGLINNLSQKQLFRSHETPFQNASPNRIQDNMTHTLQNEFHGQNFQNNDSLNIHRSDPQFNSIREYGQTFQPNQKSPEFTPLKERAEPIDSIQNSQRFVSAAENENVPELTLYMEDILQSAEYQQMKQSLEQI